MDFREKQIINSLSNLTEEERLLHLRKMVNGSLSWLRKRNKSSDNLFNHKGDRGGRNCAKNQTLYSNLHNNARLYNSSLEDLKSIIKHI